VREWLRVRAKKGRVSGIAGPDSSTLRESLRRCCATVVWQQAHDQAGETRSESCGDFLEALL